MNQIKTLRPKTKCLYSIYEKGFGGCSLLCSQVATFSSQSTITFIISISGQSGSIIVWDSLNWNFGNEYFMQFLKKFVSLGLLHEIYMGWGLLKKDANIEIGWSVDKLLTKVFIGK